MSRVTSHAKIKKVVVDILQFKKKIFPGLLNFFFSKQVKKKITFHSFEVLLDDSINLNHL